MKLFIGKWSIMLRWWLFFTLINLGTVIAGLTGVLSNVNEVDMTKISFLIYIIFYLFSVRIGIHTYKASKGDVLTEPEANEYVRKSEVGWFASDSMMTLGMIGTVIGFIIMLGTSFNQISTSNIASMQMALMSMSKGVSTALYTTGTGLICGLLLKVQLVSVDVLFVLYIPPPSQLITPEV